MRLHSLVIHIHDKTNPSLDLIANHLNCFCSRKKTIQIKEASFPAEDVLPLQLAWDGNTWPEPVLFFSVYIAALLCPFPICALIPTGTVCGSLPVNIISCRRMHLSQDSWQKHLRISTLSWYIASVRAAEQQLKAWLNSLRTLYKSYLSPAL